MKNKFTIRVGENIFTIVKVFEDVDFYLYVLPNDKSKNGFFMTKNKNDTWEVSNKMLVSNDILVMEDQIVELITEELR